MTTPTVRIIPGRITTETDDNGRPFARRDVSLFVDGEELRGEMEDPSFAWQSVDQWISWRHHDRLLELGFYHDRIVDLFRVEVWGAYPGASIDLTAEAASYAGLKQIVLRATYSPEDGSIAVTVTDRRFSDRPARVGTVREQFNFDALEDEPTDWISWQLRLIPYGLTESAWFAALRECAQMAPDDGEVYEVLLSVDQLDVTP